MQLQTVELKRGPRGFYPVPIHTNPDAELLELANVDDLRQLMRCGDYVSTGHPWANFSAVMDAAREVRAASVGHPRFNGAEVDLAVAREIRSISKAAEAAVVNLRSMAELLKGGA